VKRAFDSSNTIGFHVKGMPARYAPPRRKACGKHASPHVSPGLLRASCPAPLRGQRRCAPLFKIAPGDYHLRSGAERAPARGGDGPGAGAGSDAGSPGGPSSTIMSQSSCPSTSSPSRQPPFVDCTCSWCCDTNAVKLSTSTSPNTPRFSGRHLPSVPAIWQGGWRRRRGRSGSRTPSVPRPWPRTCLPAQLRLQR